MALWTAKLNDMVMFKPTNKESQKKNNLEILSMFLN
jgi:hypothetical protein